MKKPVETSYIFLPKSLLSDPKMTPSAIVVYAGIAKALQGRQTGEIGRRLLAENCRVSLSTTHKAVKLLVSRGYISVRQTEWVRRSEYTLLAKDLPYRK